MIQTQSALFNKFCCFHIFMKNNIGKKHFRPFIFQHQNIFIIKQDNSLIHTVKNSVLHLIQHAMGYVLKAAPIKNSGYQAITPDRKIQQIVYRCAWHKQIHCIYANDCRYAMNSQIILSLII